MLHWLYHKVVWRWLLTVGGVTFRTPINTAMQKALWDSYRISQFDLADDVDWGEIELRLHGTPTWYFGRRDCEAFAEWKPASPVQID